MSKSGAFFWGALGGFLPILALLVTVDLAPIIDNAGSLTFGNYVGYGIRVTALIILGGIIALLNTDVRQPLALVQLGIAAPALVTAYINSRPVPAAGVTQRAWFEIISTAHAGETSQDRVRVAGFLNDVRNGIGRPLGQIQNSAPTGADTGTFCTTPAGRFGPVPANRIGSSCTVNSGSGPIQGLVSK
jgi:hypothetical protein